MRNDIAHLHNLATDARDAAALAWDRLLIADAQRLAALALGYSIAARIAHGTRSSLEAVAA